MLTFMFDNVEELVKFREECIENTMRFLEFQRFFMATNIHILQGLICSNY